DNMQATNFVFLELLLVFSSEGTCFYGYYLAHCQFNSPGSSDVVFVEQLYFNKILLGQYNSTLGKVVAFTKKAEEFADMLNKMPRFLTHEMRLTNHCKISAQLANEKLLTAVEPYVWLRSVKAEYSQHQQKLVCSAYDFYPKKIRELPNGNWLYQIHSYLEFTPKPGEKIACMVEHASLKEPKLYDWAGLLLGLLFSVTGFLFFKKKSIGETVVQSNRNTIKTIEIFYSNL
uniref:Ig-like domain-containing protein n=1 Tax=Poecilia mexicana TaxID=48701 RepID=A0A3B3X249_9TELE